MTPSVRVLPPIWPAGPRLRTPPDGRFRALTDGPRDYRISGHVGDANHDVLTPRAAARFPMGVGRPKGRGLLLETNHDVLPNARGRKIHRVFSDPCGATSISGTPATPNRPYPLRVLGAEIGNRGWVPPENSRTTEDPTPPSREFLGGFQKIRGPTSGQSRPPSVAGRAGR
jgi:hypothetical protein